MKRYEHIWFVVGRDDSKCIEAIEAWNDELQGRDYWSCIVYLEQFGCALCAIRDYPEKQLVEYYMTRTLI